MMLSDERRRRLVGAMADAGVDEMVLYGNAWQGDYLRYACDFGILEGHGIAVVAADGSVELFLDSAVEVERAETEVSGLQVTFASDIARAVGTRLDRVANHRVAAAPVMSVVDTVSHPHYKARNMIRTVPDRILGEVMIPGFPLKFSAFPKPLEISAPLLGEHGDAILRGQLGMRDDEIAELRSQGVLYSENK